MDEHTKLAKNVMLAILSLAKESGQGPLSWAELDKVWYVAHVRFADTQAGYLTSWPTVRGVDGPQIGKGGLMCKLIHEWKAGFDEDGWRFIPLTGFSAGDLPDGAVEAIQYGVDQSTGTSHMGSRAWRLGKNGDELNIYLDSLSDEVYAEYMTQGEAIGKTIKEVFTDTPGSEPAAE